jgi:hypothetical protein
MREAMGFVRKSIKTLAAIGASLSGLFVVYKFVVGFLNMVGNIQTAQQVAGWIPWKWISESSWWIAPAICVGCLILILAVWRSEREKHNGFKEPKEPQPVILAIDELKSLLNEGEILVNRFQEDSVKPTLGEVEDWRQRMRQCARQKILATENLVTAKDLLKLDKEWDRGDVLRITGEFVDHGCFDDGSVEMAVFQSAWGRVQRLKELISKIEGEEPDTKEKNAGLVQPAQLSRGHERLVTAVDEFNEQKKSQIEAAKQREKHRRDVLLCIVDYHKQNYYDGPKALQVCKADELESNDELLKLCDELVKYHHPHPLLEIKNHVPQEKWLDFLKEARLRGMDLGDKPALTQYFIKRHPVYKELSAGRSPAVITLVDEALRIIREDKVQFTLYALQKAGAGDLESDEQFLDACQAIIQRNLPDPIKDLSVAEYGITWLELIRFANTKEVPLYNKVAVYDCLQRRLTESQQTLPKKPIHIAVDRLRALQRYGKKMRQRLIEDEPPIPSNREIEEWTKEIVDVAASCASLVERDNLQVHYKYLGLNTFVLGTNRGRKDYEERIGTVSAKLHIIGKIISRLLNEDMMAHL